LGELEARRDRCERDAQPFGARDRLLGMELSAGVILFHHLLHLLHIRRSAGQAALGRNRDERKNQSQQIIAPISAPRC
jgi:hypothetical protein